MNASTDARQVDMREINRERQAQHDRLMARGRPTSKAPLPEPKTPWEAQARAERAYRIHGLRPPEPTFGEPLLQYRRRLVQPLMAHSDQWKRVSAWKLDSQSVGIAEAQCIADAIEKFEAPTGALRMEETRDDAGRTIRRFYGDPEETWGIFKQVPLYARFDFWNVGRGPNAPGVAKPVATLMSDGSTRAIRE